MSSVQQLYFMHRMDPEKIPRLHLALKATYGSDCVWNLNRLSALLRKLALSSTGLIFLLRCRRFNIFPKFVLRSVRFARLGRHLERLAVRLPRRILHAAIRDVRAREACLQQELNFVWNSLYRLITDASLWNRLVFQKDNYFSHLFTAAI